MALKAKEIVTDGDTKEYESRLEEEALKFREELPIAKFIVEKNRIMSDMKRYLSEGNVPDALVQQNKLNDLTKPFSYIGK